MFLNIVLIFLVLCVVICALLYRFQEKLIFFPEQLDKDFTFRFEYPFEEVNIKMADGIVLNSILFRSGNSRGLIFYLHGNAGSVNSWGDVAGVYTSLGYDVFMPDYRGYGKSEGKITSQEQLFLDMQTAYNFVKTKYDERKIVVLGYSIGSAPATKMASVNHPRLLILQAPFYSLSDLVKHIYPVIPVFLLKYKFENNKFIQQCSMPITIFHGDRDEIIYYESSVKLMKLTKKTDTLIRLNGEGHNGMSSNERYVSELRRILIE